MSRDAQRAGDVIAHARALVKKSDGEKSLVAVDQMIRGVLSLVQPEVAKHSVVVEEALADARPEPDHERDRCDGEGDVASAPAAHLLRAWSRRVRPRHGLTLYLLVPETSNPRR